MPISTTTPEILFQLHRDIHGRPPSDPLEGPSHCLIAKSNNEATAGLCCQIAQINDKNYGMISYYTCKNADSGVELLQAALAHFSTQSIQRIIGPIDGSTWARYRWSLTSEPPSFFLGEPINPLAYPQHFESAGFKIAETYESRSLSTPIPARKTAPLLAQRLKARAIQIQPLDMSRYDSDLLALFDLSLDSFSHNPYYSPIPKSQFLDKYRALKPLIDPDCVLLALDPHNQLVGFLFAYPDYPSSDRLIVKTIAVTPSMRPLGLAIALLDTIHQIANQKGYKQVIHALMHEKNSSLKLSIHLGSEPFRRYGLYSYEL